MNPKAVVLTTALLLSATFVASAVTYIDATGENFTTAGGGILDISSVEVNNTATDLNFKINLTGNPVATDWGKYMIGISSTSGGDTAGNGWGRPISLAAGMNYWVGSWVDSGNGAELRNYTGSWGLQSATYAANPDSISITKDASSVTLNFNFAGLGLSSGSTFLFDVYTSGGGGSDGAVDALSNPSQSIANWGDSYNTASPFVNSYTITPVPEPTSFALLGLGGLLLARRVIDRK